MLQKMRKHRKRLMAIFGVVLMVAFLIPTTTNLFKDSNPVVAYWGAEREKISDGERVSAQRQWEMLIRLRTKDSYESWAQQEIFRRVAGPASEQKFFMAQLRLRAGMGDEKDRDIITQLQQDYRDTIQVMSQVDGITYYLLMKEAERLGAAPGEEDAKATLQALKVPVKTELGDARTFIVLDFMRVLAAFDRVAAAVKTSEPMALRQEVDRDTRIGVRAVQFKATDFGAPASVPATAATTTAAATPPGQQTPPPTAEEIAHFNKFRSFFPWNALSDEEAVDVDPKENPLGLGYKVPDRVEVEFIQVSRAYVRAQVQVPETALWRFFRDNRWSPENPSARFPATTQVAASGPATRPPPPPGATQAARVPATFPTTARPTKLIDFRPQIESEVIEGFTNLITSELIKDITTLMAEDYAAYQEQTRGGKNPTTAPAGSVKVPYASEDYLSKLVEAVSRRWVDRYAQLYEKTFPREKPGRPFNAELAVSAVGTTGLKSRKELRELGRGRDASGRVEGIGNSQLADNTGVTFAEYAVGRAAPLLDEKQVVDLRNRGLQTLGLFQPSPLFQAMVGKGIEGYVFRLRAAEKEAAPAEITPVLAAVRADMRTLRGYERAKAKADEFRKAAKALGGLQGAANDLAWQLPNWRLIDVDAFTRNAPSRRIARRVPSLELSGPSVDLFTSEAFKLLDEKLATGAERPVGVIELPLARKVVVAQFDPSQYEPVRRDPYFAGRLAESRELETERRTRAMLLSWLTPKNVQTRTNLEWKNKEAAKDTQ